MIHYVPLKELLQTVVDNRGRTCPTATSGTPLIATNCIKNSSLYPVFERVRYVDQKTYSDWFRGHPVPGDLIFVLKGSPGQVCLTPDPVGFCIAQDMVAIRANSKVVYPSYLFAALRSDMIQNEIVNMHVGTMIPHFKKGDFDKLKIPLPDWSTQKFIGDAYLTLSKKIEVNNQMNETLRTLAKTFFDASFANGCWETTPLGYLVTIFDGPHATPKFTDNGPVFLGISNLSQGRIDLTDIKYLSESDFVRWTRRVTPSPGDIAFSYETRLGQAAMIPPNLTCCLGRRMGLLRVKDGRLAPEILLQAYMSTSFQDLIRQRTIYGSTVERIPLTEMASFPICVPNREEAKRLGAMLIPLRKMEEANARETQTITSLRDFMLPRLMSGEIRVSDTNGVLEAVA